MRNVKWKHVEEVLEQETFLFSKKVTFVMSTLHTLKYLCRWVFLRLWRNWCTVYS